jgi:cyclic pyranopterin phosphate synthase
MDAAVGKRKVHWEWVRGETGGQFHKEAHSLATSLASQLEMAPPAPAEKGKTPVPPAELTHIDEAGRPRMVDISGKLDSRREAVARGSIKMQPATLDLIKKGQMAKGDVLTVAQLAGIMAAKQTPHLIPLCHPILIGDVKIEFSIDDQKGAIDITATVESTGKTGVEMEALTAAAVAALTIYDMGKAADRGMRIENIRLVRKSGGKSGTIILES